jgi:hypothetical protein
MSAVFLCRLQTDLQLIHNVFLRCGTRELAGRFGCMSARCSIRGAVMRTMSFFLTASIFSSIFIGLALASAVITGAVHAQFASRSALMSVMQN